VSAQTLPTTFFVGKVGTAVILTTNASWTMTTPTLQTVRGAISATFKYIPNHDASQAKTFVTEQVPKAAGAVSSLLVQVVEAQN
jgi:hypothetical protein